MILDSKSPCFQSILKSWTQALGERANQVYSKLQPGDFRFRALMLHEIASQLRAFHGQSLLVEWEEAEKYLGRKRFVRCAYLARLEDQSPTESIVSCSWKLARAKRRHISFRISVRAKRTIGKADFSGSLKKRLLLDPFLDTLDPALNRAFRNGRIFVGTSEVKHHFKRTRTKALIPLL